MILRTVHYGRPRTVLYLTVVVLAADFERLEYRTGTRVYCSSMSPLVDTGT